MNISTLSRKLLRPGVPSFRAGIPEGLPVSVQGRSIHELEGCALFLYRTGSGEALRLGCVHRGEPASLLGDFELSGGSRLPDGWTFSSAELSRRCGEALRRHFPFTRPRVLGLHPSFGFGDRLGLANPAHLRALRKRPMDAILAQQSVRELERTQRTPEEVLDAASWSAFREDYRDGFGADADHLKQPADVRRLAAAGYTFFTFDPGEHVVNEADHMSRDELFHQGEQLEWDRLGDSLPSLLRRWTSSPLRLASGFELSYTEADVLRALNKYGRVLSHVRELYSVLEESMQGTPFEVELSVDETEAVTSPFEHYWVVSELQRLEVKLHSVAPRYVGSFEKGIDYRGRLDEFETEYRKHAAVASRLGPYKLSLHSGSDKFSIYPIIASVDLVPIHVKTAGTSYLEALRAIAWVDSDFFAEIFDFSRSRYEDARHTYHVSARLEQVPVAAELPPEDRVKLLDDDDARQVLHVAFGDVLTNAHTTDRPGFKSRLIGSLQLHEKTHFECLEHHFGRHLELLT